MSRSERIELLRSIWDLPPEDPYPKAAGFHASTIPGLFVERCGRTPDRVAFRFKDRGLYKEVTWRTYLEQVETFCMGLVELGLDRGDRVAIMGDPCPEWLYADLAAQSAGALSYGIYSTSSVSETRWMMENGGARFFVAQNQEFVDKVLSVAEHLPALKRIIVADTSAMFMYEDDRIITFKEVQRLGQRRGENEECLFRDLVSRVRPEDVATIVYTSGTTGVPKGVMITHHNLLWSRLEVPFLVPEFFNEEARSVAYLPLAHVLARFQDEYFPMIGNHITHFGESPELMAETMFEVSPTIFMGAPRTLEKFAAQALVGIESSSWLKKACYRTAMKIGRRHLSSVWEGRTTPVWRLLYGLSRTLVFRPLLEKLGFAGVKFCMVGATPVPPEVLALFQVWGVPAGEMYGQTEGGNVSAQVKAFARPGTAGKVFPRISWKHGENGEFLIRGPGAFPGFWADEEASSKVKDGEGWVHTGDLIGFTGEGELKVVGRIKDIQITAGGKNLSPELIEKALKASPFISEAVVFADGRKYPAALIEIDFDTVSEWARNHDVLYSGFTSLATNPKVTELIAEEVKTRNQQLARVEQIKKFRIIPKEFDPEDEDDPITCTRKIRRQKVYERYRDLVESMFGDEREEKLIIMAEMGSMEEQLRKGGEG
ncbi:MAG: AMP-binding protein [Thermodesulfobacteriota bacterium]